jgi:hypothetical protein
MLMSLRIMFPSLSQFVWAVWQNRPKRRVNDLGFGSPFQRSLPRNLDAVDVRQQAGMRPPG